MKVKILILTGYGINAEKELAWAFDLAGGETKIIHLEDLISNVAILKDYRILAFPGGFSFGDHIASGKIFGNKIKYTIFSELTKFIDGDKLVIGICNGFQVITKFGLVPNTEGKFEQTASLIGNDSGHFENRWIWVKNLNKNSIWLKDIDNLYLPVRHGEGKFIVKNDAILDEIKKNGQIALQFYNPDSNKAEYPYNPNGSIMDIAGITNKKGNVFGLMPHPEAYIFPQNNPNWSEDSVTKGTMGLKIFQNGVDYFK